MTGEAPLCKGDGYGAGYAPLSSIPTLGESKSWLKDDRSETLLPVLIFRCLATGWELSEGTTSTAISSSFESVLSVGFFRGGGALGAPNALNHALKLGVGPPAAELDSTSLTSFSATTVSFKSFNSLAGGETFSVSGTSIVAGGAGVSTDSSCCGDFRSSSANLCFPKLSSTEPRLSFGAFVSVFTISEFLVSFIFDSGPSGNISSVLVAF